MKAQQEKKWGIKRYKPKGSCPPDYADYADVSKNSCFLGSRDEVGWS